MIEFGVVLEVGGVFIVVIELFRFIGRDGFVFRSLGSYRLATVSANRIRIVVGCRS